jgi:hypothetical protein
LLKITLMARHGISCCCFYEISWIHVNSAGGCRFIGLLWVGEKRVLQDFYTNHEHEMEIKNLKLSDI